MTSLGEKLLILDLDETLIHATEAPSRPPDFLVGQYSVSIRPGVPAFLELCHQHFRVAVWTSSTETYAAAVVEHIFGPGYPLEFVWSRQRCSRAYNPELQSHELVKDLAKVRKRGFDLSQVLVVDDTPSMLARNYGNLVRVVPYRGEIDDRELELLWPYLLELKEAPNVRAIEKRGWREGPANQQHAG